MIFTIITIIIIIITMFTIIILNQIRGVLVCKFNDIG